MAESPFSISLSSASSQSRSRSLFGFLAALVLQSGALALAVVYPLFAVEAPPRPAAPPPRTQQFVPVVPAPQPVRASAAAGSERPSSPRSAETHRRPPRWDMKLLDRFFAPPEIPEGIGDEVWEVWSGADGLSLFPGGSGPGTGASVSETPAAPPPPEAPLRAGGRIQPPRKIAHAEPVYPEIARRGRIEGLVVLETLIDRDGTVRDATVVRGHPLLERAALEAVRRWRYEPTLLNGAPVPVLMTVTIRFELN